MVVVEGENDIHQIVQGDGPVWSDAVINYTAFPISFQYRQNTHSKSTQRAQTSADAKILTESDPRFESGFSD